MKFQLITYNVHRAIGLDRRFRLDRIAQVLHDHDADIVLLQEAEDRYNKMFMQDIYDLLDRAQVVKMEGDQQERIAKAFHPPGGI